jgi:hypothetical protein
LADTVSANSIEREVDEIPNRSPLNAIGGILVVFGGCSTEPVTEKVERQDMAKNRSVVPMKRGLALRLPFGSSTISPV